MDEDGDVGVVQDAVAVAADDGLAEFAQPTAPHHDQPGVLRLREVNDLVPDVRAFAFNFVKLTFKLKEKTSEHFILMRYIIIIIIIIIISCSSVVVVAVA